jgi:hypothetical protein
MVFEGSGAYINSAFSPITFTLAPNGQTTVNLNANFTIP